jgi:pimeloyl-ACP methyl ester carboxylesterase
MNLPEIIEGLKSGMPRVLSNSVNINYIMHGGGRKTFLLIHNAGGNLYFMNHLSSHLSQHGRIVNVDLRGHGESDKPNSYYGVNTYAEDMVSLCQELAIEKATVVGLNYGGVVGIELASMSGELLSELVLINMPVQVAPWVKTLIQEHINDLQDSSLENFSKNLVESVITECAEEDKLMAIKAFDTTSRAALISTYQDLLKWDLTSQEKIQQCLMPMLNIQTSNPFCSEQLLRTLCPHIITETIDNCGPWATLEAPVQVNAMIDRFLAL